MKNFRMLSLVLVVIAALAVIPSALAQDTLGLSDSDFALWGAANETSSAQSSFNYAFNLSIVAAGIPETDLNMNINGSGGITEESFSMLIDGAIAAMGEEMPAALEVRTVGDNLYVNLGGTWYGGSADELMGMASGMAGALPVNPMDLASGDMSGMMGDDQMMGLMSALSEMQASDFLSASRLADTAEGYAVIELSIGIADLMTSDAFAPLLGGAIMGSMGGAMSGAAVPTVDPAQAAMAAQMFGTLFEDAVFTITQAIDPATNLVQNTVINFSLPLGQLMAMGGETGAADAVVNFVFDISLSDYGAGTVAAAPESFEPISGLFEGLAPMMGSM